MSEKIVKVGKKFTIVIPKEVRKKAKINEGEILKIKLKEKSIVLEKIEDPYKILEKVIGKPYDEKEDEKRAEEFLKHARS